MSLLKKGLSEVFPTPFSTKMEAILEELRELRQIVQSLQPESQTIPICEGVTGKGTQCRNRASPDSCYCRMHGERDPKPPRVVKPKRVVKLKKVQPEHNHGGGGVCMLCETHGDVLDPGLPDVEFEGCEIAE
jgi:hypothetical protein